MQSLCGQCQKPYSLACEKPFKCQWHCSDCFSCKPCKTTAPLSSSKLVKCSFCPRIYPEEDLYYQYRCNSYICCHHFLKQNFHTNQIKLPCSHMEDVQQIACFMSHFCIYCGRKMHYSSSWSLGICLPCEKNMSVQQNIPSNEQKYSEGEEFEEKEKPNSISPKPQIKESDSQMEIVAILQKELQDAHQRLKVADYSRRKLRRMLISADRDNDCPICLQTYNLSSRMPFMICLRQHLVCQHCFNSQTGLSNCPLCHQTIVRQHVMVSRERRTTLELQSFLTHKYDYHLAQYSMQKNQAQEKGCQSEIKDEQQKTPQSTPKQEKILISQQTQTIQQKLRVDFFPILAPSRRQGARPAKATKSRSAGNLNVDKK